MRLTAPARTAARGPRRTSFVRWWAACAVLLFATLLPAARAAAQQVVPDTQAILNHATASFNSGDFTATTEAEVTVVMKLTAGVSLTPSRQATARPGERRVFAHVVENTGTGPDRYVLSVQGPAGWAVSLYLDGNGDGVLGSEDTPVSGPLPLARGAKQALLAVVDVPADAPDDGAGTVRVTATSQMDAAVSAAVQDLVTVHRPLPAVQLAKTVDRAEATPGDTLTYTLSAQNRGDAVAPAAELNDPLPAGARYVAGSLRLNGVVLTDAADGDAGEVVRAENGAERLVVRLGDLAPAAAATLTFKTIVAADAHGALSNVATLKYRLGESTPVIVSSPPAGTQVAMPQLSLSKEADADSVRMGGTVRFRLSWKNESNTLPVRDAVLVDTLPEGLAFVSAELQPDVSGQVVTWHLGTVAPGTSGALYLTVRATVAGGGVPVVNRAVIRGSNSTPETASAAPLQVLDFEGNELEVTKAAGVLEAGLGDAIPYTIGLHNRGLAPLSGIVLRDSLPAGVAYLPATLAGADSAKVNGRELSIFWQGPLVADASHQIRYAVSVVSPGGATSLVNRVNGRAEGGRVNSATATAFVRLRRGFAVQQRVVVGKVWVDLNDNGRQEQGEPGAAGVEVWSEDGQVATTDREGRYSFPNLRTGEHALRLDTLGLPAGTGIARRNDIIARVKLDGWTLPQADFRLIPREGGSASSPAATPSVPAATLPAMAAVLPSDAAQAAVAVPSSAPPQIPSQPVVIASTAATIDAPLMDAPRTGATPALVAAPVPSTTPATGVTTQAAPGDPSSGPASPATTVTGPAVDSIVAPKVAPLRTQAERAEEERQALVRGPVVRIASPVDGTVVGTNRIYVGLAGEPGAEVKLYDGAREIGEGTLRPDGRIDFVAIELSPGPHRLRAWMKGMQGERWDSVSVHRSGDVARLQAPAGAVTMHAGDREGTDVRFVALDRWGVPVAGHDAVTLDVTRAAVASADADNSSVGMQATIRGDGSILVNVRPGQDVGPGELVATNRDVKARVALRVLPSLRPLLVTGAGQVGVGAAPQAFGSVTARGSLGRETAVSVSYDSRRGTGTDDDYFGRGFDPLDEGRYPTLGDGSSVRDMGSSTQRLTARVERGFDFVEGGDVRTAEFGLDERLGYYQRALTGVSGRVSTGSLTWRGYGSFTDQVLSQAQLRGNGTSGPYRFGGGVRPGTDRVAVEVRALDNAARVLARQELVRYNDYQIDYNTGEILLTRPVPAADAAGNPVFIVAMLERRAGGDRHFVGGLRMDLDAVRALGVKGFDTLGVSLMGVRDGGDGVPGFSQSSMVGAGANLRRGGISAGAQLLRSLRPDSSAMAGLARLSWSFLSDDRGRIGAEWLQVGAGFAPGTDPRLSAGVREVRATAELSPAEGSRLSLSHEMQRFDGYGTERQATTLRAQQTVAGHAITAEGGLTRDAQGDASTSSGQAKLTMNLYRGVDVWLLGSQMLSNNTPAGQVAAARPDQVGVGASLGLIPGLRLEGSHRWVKVRGDSASEYQLSSVNLATSRLLGAEFRAGLDHADDKRMGSSAVLGWNQRLAITGGWSLTGMYERRFGLNQASLLDPNRALPFAQVERNRWSGGAGLEYLPGDSASARFSVRSELHGGQDGKGFRIDVGGDAPLGRNAALLMRNNWLSDQRNDVTGGQLDSRNDLSLLGMALRPASSDAVNMLAKIEWRRTMNPFGGGVLADVGENRRLIGSTDLVWNAARRTELAGRYAVRWATLRDTVSGSLPVKSFAHFMGLRADQGIQGPLRFRLDGRMLVDGNGGGTRWNLAPALLRSLGNTGLEIEAGYRFGELEDADFAAQGGKGFYATLNLRFTESLLTDAAQFWRERLGRGDR